MTLQLAPRGAATVRHSRVQKCLVVIVAFSFSSRRNCDILSNLRVGRYFTCYRNSTCRIENTQSLTFHRTLGLFNQHIRVLTTSSTFSIESNEVVPVLNTIHTELGVYLVPISCVEVELTACTLFVARYHWHLLTFATLYFSVVWQQLCKRDTACASGRHKLPSISVSGR